LPLLFHNLRRQGAGDIPGRIKGVYRRTWYENQVLLHQMAELLEQFHQAGVRTLALKGAALIAQFYGDPGLRPMDDFDVLVPVEQADHAVGVLQAGGWAPKRRTAWRHGCNFIDALGREVDLHTHVMQDCLDPRADQAFWDGALPITVGRAATSALNPADQLLHVCAHGLRWNRVPPIRWVADAAIIVRSSAEKLEWQRLIDETARRGLALPLHAALTYLAKTFAVAIPNETLTALAGTPVTFVQSAQFEDRLHGLLPVSQVARLAWRYGPSGGRPHRRLAGLAKYLQGRWQLASPWHVAAWPAIKASRRLVRKLAKRPAANTG
jgi:hypothetical protein